MDVFKKIQSRIKMMEAPHHLNQFHLIGLVHFAAEAATELRNINCDGSHTLWTKFATTPLLKNLIKKHCRHQATVCASLLSLPHNPLTPAVLDLFAEENGAFDLINILKNVISERIERDSIEAIHNKIEHIADSLSLMSQHQIAVRVMDMYYDCPMAHPALTLKSFQHVKNLKVKYADKWEESYFSSLKLKIALNLIENPAQSINAAQYYVHNLDETFKDSLYSMCVDSLQWQMKNKPQDDVTAIIEALNTLPNFIKWLTTTNVHNDTKNLLVAHHENTLLTAAVKEKTINRIKKM